MQRQAFLAPVQALADDLATCLHFFSRLPVPEALFLRADRTPLAHAMRVVPLAGLVIGTCGVIGLVIADTMELPSAVAAAAAISCLILATGGLHEDGLADTADGLGGGKTRERKLDIMRDSRIGTYGVLAVALVLITRLACLATLLDRSGLRASVAAILASAAVSRALTLLPLAVLPPARENGTAFAAGRPAPHVLATCAGLAITIGLGLPSLTRLGLPHAILACAAALLAASAAAETARRHIGGQTGDIAGTIQQVAEIAYLVGLMCFPA